jgi:ribonuclease R
MAARKPRSPRPRQENAKQDGARAPTVSRGKKAKPTRFPTQEQILAFIRESEGKVGKREIARAFQLKGAERIRLKALLKEMVADGSIDCGEKRQLALPGKLPEVVVVQVIGADEDGDLWARPIHADPSDAEPRIVIVEARRLDRPLGAGDRVLVRLQQTDADLYEARPIRRLDSRAQRVVGLLERAREGHFRLVPTDKRMKSELHVHPKDVAGAKPGEIVVVEAEPARRLGQPRARVIERVGLAGEASSISLISVAEHSIPMEFSPAALAQAKASGPAPLGNRRDLRDMPLVTIDGADARDFDDAVFAEADSDPANPGGWRLVVAIADVAYYVPAGSALDKTARERGNSVYFPDRVVPMLPEELSNGWCSLKPNEDRPCMVVEIVVDAQGEKRRHRFTRALMRSCARLTYEQVQRAADGRHDETTMRLNDAVIGPLYGAFRSLSKARLRRGTLELDLPERVIHLGSDGHVSGIEPRQRLDSHRLIEEFMIAANVCAAEALEKRRQPCMYRIHDMPDPARIDALRQFLDGLDLRLARGQVLRPAHFTALLVKAAKTPYASMISSLVLRAQAQAVYSPENIGHFGLALKRYAHFTSPIRRYSDLLVHRALISAYGFGEDGLPDWAANEFEGVATHISATERRATAAERDAADRYVAAFLAGRVHETFRGRVNGVAKFGLFVTLEDTGADGLLPTGLLPGDYYDHDERAHALHGRRWGRRFELGAPITVRLVSATPLTGGLTFEYVDGGRLTPDDLELKRSLKPHRSSRAPEPSKKRPPGKRQRR